MAILLLNYPDYSGGNTAVKDSYLQMISGNNTLFGKRPVQRLKDDLRGVVVPAQMGKTNIAEIIIYNFRNERGSLMISQMTVI